MPPYSPHRLSTTTAIIAVFSFSTTYINTSKDRPHISSATPTKTMENTAPAKARTPLPNGPRTPAARQAVVPPAVQTAADRDDQSAERAEAEAAAGILLAMRARVEQPLPQGSEKRPRMRMTRRIRRGRTRRRKTRSRRPRRRMRRRMRTRSRQPLPISDRLEGSS